MNLQEGFAPYNGYETWYRITGSLDSGKVPLVIVHGGPGSTHDYVDSFKDIAKTGRAVIHYDQIGNGKSTHLRDKKGDFWTIDFFKNELQNLIAHLGIEDSYCLLGQSWGGMLCAEFAVDRPKGLKSLILANAPASLKTWVEESKKLRQALPNNIDDVLLKHEQAGTTDSVEYAKASEIFNQNYLCRVVPMPDDLMRSFLAIQDDATVYNTMNGPNDFLVIGTLKDWEIVGRISSVNVPTLLISGRYDEATIACVKPYFDKIENVRWTIFGASSHMPHMEEREACMRTVIAFLDETTKL